MNPGGHGIFDFIHRDPGTMLPYLSTSRVEPAKRTVSLGSWMLPLSSGKVSLLRQGKAFWEILAEHGTPATVYRVPANFPPVESPARTFAGMGTPASPTILTLPSHSLKKHGSPSSGALTGHN